MKQETDNKVDLEQGMKAALDYFDKVSSFAKSQPVNEVKQTAVEWLKQQYIERGDTLPSGIFEQAKQMEKNQHRHTWLYEGDIDNASYERFERYYQVTFGGQGSPDTSPNTQNK